MKVRTVQRKTKKKALFPGTSRARAFAPTKLMEKATGIEESPFTDAITTLSKAIQVKNVLDLMEIDGEAATLTIHQAVMNGIATKAADRFKEELLLTDKDLAGALGTSESTLSRLRKSRHKLDPVSSDRLIRHVKLFELASEVFESKDMAISWLKRPQYGLGNQVPLELMKSEEGARSVENLLMRIEHGNLA